MANKVLNCSISFSRLVSNQYLNFGYKFLQNRLVKPTERWLDCQLAPISWSTHAQHVLCERISAVMQAHNSCCAAYGDYFSENLYYLFRQLLPYSTIVSYALSFDIIRLSTHFIEMAKNNPNFFFVIQKKMSSFADEM